MKLTNISDAAKYKIGKYLIHKIRDEDGLTEPLNQESLVAYGQLFIQVVKDNKIGKLPEYLIKDFNEKFILTKKELSAVLKTGAKKFLEYTSEKKCLGESSLFAELFSDGRQYIEQNIYDPAEKGQKFVPISDGDEKKQATMLTDVLEQFINKSGSSWIFVSQLQVLIFTFSNEGDELRKFYQDIEDFWRLNQKMDMVKFKKNKTILDCEKHLEALLKKVENIDRPPVIPDNGK